MKKNGFSRCAELYIGLLKKEGRYSTAHVYKNALFSFTKFCGTANVSFRQVSRERLRCYGEHLYSFGLKPNTVSTYMRMLRSIYNRGVEAGNAPYVHRLFHDVYTGVDIRQKKALPIGELHRLLYEDPKSERLRRTQAIAALMFQFCGMSFADLAHLEKSSLDGCNILRYNRIKTKTPMSVEVLDTAKDMIDQLRNDKPSLPDCPDYLFSILHGDKKRKDECAYREYQSALRLFNNHLKCLAKALRLTSRVTSYSLRHSWATTAKYRGVSIEMISESLGHKSIKTTQIYLKGFGLQERTEVNRKNLSYVKSWTLGRGEDAKC
ncbi:tyrosine-type DNA invertase cluster 3b [Bacteroides thetaiotaomicron]|uniref:Tyrosine-type DNA invertase cluster 3b n=1 Tax=Bacteroides thetaiotaomicron TaxID=818 RepID=A0A943DQ45_BACT4|nr:tyrosine-type DNA invertase cluster 3b [Bacteroides thetaiotaomicron]MBS5410117.1 tyrosine-type DNA invertase cluster 3b [Bacteroides thetaiotaomicron]MCE8950629.1 tyrosine-type DNA invertase cluster 3b [Bacteroides thetaiotaomicron]MCE8968144.1 tyrosine-type DNA invertase cluster 3b [Bacteroides thetaiotaomicron]